MSSAHGGNLRELARRAGRKAEDILDFSASVNPLGPPACLRRVISRTVDRLVNYPDPQAAELVEAIARRYRLPPERIVVGNGSTELLFAVPRVAQVLNLCHRRAVIPVPAYSDYASAAALAGLAVKTIQLREDDGFTVDCKALAGELSGGEMVFLGRPNNPAGGIFEVAAFNRLVAEHPDTAFVVDEAFLDFVEGAASLADDVAPNVVVLRSLTKFYAIPGLRLGFAVAQEETARRLREQIPAWSVNALAQAAGVAMLADEDYAARTVAFVSQQRRAMNAALVVSPGLKVYPSDANFILVRLGQGSLDAPALAEKLLAEGIAVRVCDNFHGLDRRYFRLAIRTAEENQRLLAALEAVLLPAAAKSRAPKRRTPALMFQGTSSNAGKSVLTAALCRILLQDGLRVAPFKAQNMSLNSFVTRDGGEMGRAQVVQAQACRLEPDVRMNPVLLKPSSDTGCQVIIRGRPVEHMAVGRYIAYKPLAEAAARECYDSLAAEFDAVVLEGAGSPGEVNLKGHDIVNMRMASHAGAPVVIVGDIDRGGVFASFVGHVEVMDPWERQLLAGWVVNRFRGDASLLTDALDYTLAHTGRDVLGVVPYLHDLNLPQEDSVEEFNAAALHHNETDRPVEIAMIALPHISNFTDLDCFSVEPDVRVRIVRCIGDLNDPAAVVLPGSKNTLGDLAWLRQSGLAARITQLAAAERTEIVGVCGGFQMLGRQIADPQRIESTAGSDQGLGLLDVSTVMAAEKTLVRTKARHVRSGLAVAGYEIHHGRTDSPAAAAEFVRDDGAPAGASAADGRIWGTYLHGVFDADEFRRHFIDRLRVRRGLPAVGAVTGRYDIEPALERLAAVVRASLNMDAIYRLMGL